MTASTPIMGWLAASPRRCVARGGKADRWRLGTVSRNRDAIAFASSAKALQIEDEDAIEELVDTECVTSRSLDNGRRFFVHPKWEDQ